MLILVHRTASSQERNLDRHLGVYLLDLESGQRTATYSLPTSSISLLATLAAASMSSTVTSLMESTMIEVLRAALPDGEPIQTRLTSTGSYVPLLPRT